MKLESGDALSPPAVSQEVNRLLSLGRHCNKEHRWDEAEEAIREAFFVMHGDETSPLYSAGSFLTALSLTHEGRGETAIAEDLILTAIAEDRSLPQQGERLTQMWERNLAVFYIRQRRFDEAESILQRHLDTPGVLLNSAEYDRAFKETYLGRLRVAQERYDEAGQVFCHAIQLIEQSLGFDHPALGMPLQLYAGLMKRRGRKEKAEALLERARIIKENYLANYKPEPGKCPPIIYPED